MIKAIIRGGGDLASGIAIRLYRSGIKVIITEIEQPLTVRRYVSFAEAVYTRTITIEEIKANLVSNTSEVLKCLETNTIPVIIDKDLSVCNSISAEVLIDARMLKHTIERVPYSIPQVIGIGPGFIPGENCDCVVETKRGPFLGRVYWNSPVESDTGIPENVNGFADERVFRAPKAGIFKAKCRIGDLVKKDEEIASVDGEIIRAPFAGVIRGLLHEGVVVFPGLKVGDLDPRSDPLLCSLVSDKSLAVGGGVLEAILTNHQNRQKLGTP
ncbi:molybdenum hydroxylase [Leptolinea sp. HRD-7]|nr:molybdenum hydroxylase [Leptolinea sp. HRD-7]